MFYLSVQIVCDDNFVCNDINRFSMEILLSFIEFNQFQKYLIDNSDIDDSSKESLELIQFPSNIPLSEIIESQQTEHHDNHGDNQLSVFKVKAHELFKKYIKPGAEFEINIKSDTRNKGYRLMNDLTEFLDYNVNVNDLLTYFGSCKEEMHRLLLYSFTRFKSSKEFNEIEQIFNKEMKEEVIFEDQPEIYYLANSNSPPNSPLP